MSVHDRGPIVTVNGITFCYCKCGKRWAVRPNAQQPFGMKHQAHCRQVKHGRSQAG